MGRLQGSCSLSGLQRTGCISIGTRKGRKKSSADVENSSITGIATENVTRDITEETNLKGLYLGREKGMELCRSRLLRVLDAKLGSLDVPGDNGEPPEVYVIRNKVIKLMQ